MRKSISLPLGVLIVVTASPLLAQATRTWVSGVGDDANPCSRTAPCKTFAGAISKTAAGGEINAIDPGGFGAVTITKSITIDGYGTQASILAANVNGIIVNGAGIVVNLRNLSINGASTTTGNGIRILNAAAVDVDHVRLMNFGGTGANGRGITVETSAANTRISVSNSQIYNANNIGIAVLPTGGNVLLTVDRTDIQRSGGSGITLFSNVVASISNSNISNNVNGAGVAVEGATAVANISYSVLANNRFGIANGVGTAATTRLFDNVITGNTQDGIRINGGNVFTYGNNAIRGNAGNETPTQPPLPQQ